MEKWKHKGITIELRANGEFSASLGSGLLRSASLAGIKKQIDTALTKKFVPFNVISEGVGGKIISHTVTDRRKAGSFDRVARGRLMFESNSKDRWEQQSEFVYPDTPANRKALATYIEMRDEGQKQKSEIDAAVRDAKERITTIGAGSFTPEQIVDCKA